MTVGRRCGDAGFPTHRRLADLEFLKERNKLEWCSIQFQIPTAWLIVKWLNKSLHQAWLTAWWVSCGTLNANIDLRNTRVIVYLCCFTVMCFSVFTVRVQMTNNVFCMLDITKGWFWIIKRQTDLYIPVILLLPHQYMLQPTEASQHSSLFNIP